MANSATGFLEHDVCFNETKANSDADCTGSALSLPQTDASFFMQVVSVANHSANNTYNKVKYSSEWTVKNECDDAAKLIKCYNW